MFSISSDTVICQRGDTDLEVKVPEVVTVSTSSGDETSSEAVPVQGKNSWLLLKTRKKEYREEPGNAYTAMIQACDDFLRGITSRLFGSE